MLTIQRRLAAVIALGVLAVLTGSGCGSEGLGAHQRFVGVSAIGVSAIGDNPDVCE
jgi:hypothetical protein